MEDVYLCCASVSIEWKGMISVSRQTTIFRHIVTNRFFALRKNRGKSSVFPGSWLKSLFPLFHFNFQVRKKNAGQSFLAMKEVHLFSVFLS